MPMASSTQGARASPAPPRTTPAMSESAMAVWTLFLMLWNSPAPTCMATTTLAPMESPTNRFTNIAVTGFTPPMPASEKLLTNCPAMEASAEFSNCWRMLLSARGMANRRILPGKGPLSISMLFFFFIGASLLICAIPSSCVSLDYCIQLSSANFPLLNRFTQD